MRSCGAQATGRPRGAAVGVGLWRAAAAAPAMLCSLLLVAVATRGLGPWTAPIVLVWVACGAVGLTRAGERVAVRAAFGFRRPSPAHAAALQPLWAAALRLSATPVGEV